MALEHVVVLGIGAACHVKSDDPGILVTFLRFLTEMNDATAQAFYAAVNHFNPELVEGAMRIVQNCLAMSGVAG